ncbi:hypothetical protein AB205_0205290 [Aquarana catesbeiana]|uniref:Akirin-1 n=1 Tax=Aquarana catesbeiana TaxID=8400 RepID=A0A2G9Q7S9_AQUCT|nr:hypothetical protein AB205_0205290 [Aquarana catesbeiana]
MACGATLKCSMEFEALMSPQSPKRRWCTPLPGSLANPFPPKVRPEAQQSIRPAVFSAAAGENGHSSEVQASTSLTAPSSPGSVVKKDQPTFSLLQVGILCERLLKDHEDKIREEYEQILNTKLEELYESFVKFTHDQIMRRYGTRPTSYVS